MSDEFLTRARTAVPDLDDAALLDRALASLCAVHRDAYADHRAAEIDRSYEAYDAIPLDTEDEWGNLAGFLEAAGAA